MTLLADAIAEAKQHKRKPDAISQELIDSVYSGYIKHEKDKWRKKVSFAPSGLVYGSGACAKRWYLQFDGVVHESKSEPISIAGMRNGIASHERIQEAMRDSGIVKEIERVVQSTDPPIFGYADAILTLNGEDYVCEIKTTKHSNFEYRVRTNIIASYHLLQVLLYMYVLNISKGVVLYESKDTNELHAITIEMTDEYRRWVEDVLRWCRTVYEMYQNGEMPKRSFRAGSKICKSCPVEQECLKKDGIIKVPRLSV